MRGEGYVSAETSVWHIPSAAETCDLCGIVTGVPRAKVRPLFPRSVLKILPFDSKPTFGRQITRFIRQAVILAVPSR